MLPTNNAIPPLISVITIVYNGEKYIRQCIEAIKRQNYTKIEYIIIDAKSTDSTLAIIDEYKEVVSVLVSEKDRGISDAFNKGIALAKGEIVGIINSDDFYTDGCISDVADFYMKNNCLPGIYYGDIRYFDENSSHVRTSDFENIWKYMSIYHPSVFVSAEVYKNIGGFSEDFKYTMDAEFLHRAISKNIQFFHINKCLSNFRTVGTSDVNYKKTYQEFFKSVTKFKGSSLKINLWHAWLVFKKDMSNTSLGQFFYKRKHLIAPLLSGKIKKG
jgi:glycosyltransferase involved in cell wall biosynthesis